MAGAARGRCIVFLGPPNSGKGTQAALLAQKLEIPTISTGEMLRRAVEAESALGKRVQGVMAAGKLVDDDLMAEVVRERLGHADIAGGFILDGYPRTALQAETLGKIMEERQAAVDDVILIRVAEDVLVQRALLRGREDDREEIIRERLRVYREETAPLADFYAKLGNLRSVDGEQPVEDVSQEILSLVGDVKGDRSENRR